MPRKTQSKVKAIPAGYSSVTPYMTIKNAGFAIDFYKRAFDAEEIMRIEAPDGSISHAEIRIGNAVIMLSEECASYGAYAPRQPGGGPVAIHLYVENADKTAHNAVLAGARITHPVQDQFYGDRSGIVVDPFGHRWFISTHIEEVKPEEIRRRSAMLMSMHAPRKAG